ncbi:hypothetical protein AVEN_108676-1, partial [Araneus ventricosus]
MVGRRERHLRATISPKEIDDQNETLSKPPSPDALATPTGG